MNRLNLVIDTLANKLQFHQRGDLEHLHRFSQRRTKLDLLNLIRWNTSQCLWLSCLNIVPITKTTSQTTLLWKQLYKMVQSTLTAWICQLKNPKSIIIIKINNNTLPFYLFIKFTNRTLIILKLICQMHL